MFVLQNRGSFSEKTKKKKKKKKKTGSNYENLTDFGQFSKQNTKLGTFLIKSLTKMKKGIIMTPF